jgi:hypothetical protein
MVEEDGLILKHSRMFWWLNLMFIKMEMN